MTDSLPPAPAPKPPSPWPRRLLEAIAAVLCICLGLYLFLPDFLRAETDDAYVEAHVAPISALVPGYVMALHIDDNSPVTADEVLLELDPRDYQVRLETARADLAAAQSRLGEGHAQTLVAATAVEVAAGDAAAAAATARLADDDLRRYQGVSDQRAVSTQRLDTARAAVQSARASYDAARSRVDLARANADLARVQEQTAQSVVAQAQAALIQARLDLSYTQVRAPADGSVANKLVEIGGYVQPGQTLLSVVPTQVYVVANFKETQIDGIKPGSLVSVRIDSFPDLRLRGHVDSIERGSGSRFALLPPENATGNFVKIVQRIPVKIVLDEPPATAAPLSPGMSAVVSIDRTGAPAWLKTLF